MDNPGGFRAWALELRDVASLSAEMRRIAVDRGGIPLMAPKGVMCAILVEAVPTKAANIIKQEILARGGDLATPWSCADFAAEAVDTIILGNVVTLRSLVAKLFRQTVYQLPEIAAALQTVLLRTVPGYLPVARAPARQGFVVEETLDDLFGGRIPTQRGRATGQPTLVPSTLHPQLAWAFGTATRLAGTVTVPASSLEHASAYCRAAAARLAQQGALLAELRPATGDVAAYLPEVAAGIRTALPDLLLAVPGTCATTTGTTAAGAAVTVWRTGPEGEPAWLAHRTGTREPVLVLLDPGPVHGDPVTETHRTLWRTLEQATKAGLDAEQIIIGLDVSLLSAHLLAAGQFWRRLREFRSYGRPLWVDLTGADLPANGAAEGDPDSPPDPASLATLATLAVAGGADFICTPRLAPVQAAVRIVDAVWRTPMYT